MNSSSPNEYITIEEIVNQIISLYNKNGMLIQGLVVTPEIFDCLHGRGYPCAFTYHKVLEDKVREAVEGEISKPRRVEFVARKVLIFNNAQLIRADQISAKKEATIGKRN